MTTPLDVSRILDANANRAREGLRTTEDYVRFLLGDLIHAEQLRTLRQSLTQTLRRIGLSAELVSSRNVGTDPLQPENWKDVLRRVDTETPEDVAVRGLKRAQEAFRVLEEFIRAKHLTEAEGISKLRYRTYELEQWLVCASPILQIVHSSQIYVLLSAALCNNGDIVETTKAVLRGGARIVQLREKNSTDAAYLADLKTMKSICADFGAVLCCNDRLDAALLSGCRCLHLGQGDLTTADVRRLGGHKMVVGRSTHSVEQAEKAVEEQADYIAIGSMFETKTKETPIVRGLKLAEEVSALKLPVPVFAIGGITLERIKPLKQAGVKRVAVSQAIIGSASPETETRRFLEAMQG